MNDILNDQQGIADAETYAVIKQKMHGGLFGKFKKGISREKAQNTTSLNIHDEVIKDLDFLRFFPNLEQLILSTSSLRDVRGFKYVPKLTCLNLFGHWAGPLDISEIGACRMLEELDFSRHGTTSNVETYGLNSLGVLTRVKYLGLAAMGVQEIAWIKYMDLLEDLELAFNPIRDLSPLAGLTGITDLDLSGCGLKDISALSGLKKLERVYLDKNDIHDFSPLQDLPNLKEISAEENNLSPEEAQHWVDVFSDGEEVYFDA